MTRTGAGRPASSEDGDAGGAADSGAVPAEGAVTVVPGISRYHLAGCILIRFLGSDDLDVLPKDAALAAGCVPCKACRPG